jgi:hypothetical protein
MNADQRVFLENGGRRTYHDVGYLRYTNSSPHFHWHLMRYDAFEVRSIDGTMLLRDHKTGFCLADHYGIAPGNWPGRTPVFLGTCQQYNPKARSVLEGTSLGFTDRYSAFYHGQNVNITHLPAGVYDLVHRVNETMAIHELRYENDAASDRIRISWHKGVPGVTVLRRCQSTTTC